MGNAEYMGTLDSASLTYQYQYHEGSILSRSSHHWTMHAWSCIRSRDLKISCRLRITVQRYMSSKLIKKINVGWLEATLEEADYLQLWDSGACKCVVNLG